MGKRDEKVEVEGEVNEAASTEASFNFETDDRVVWLPRSLCDWDEHLKVMHIPEWLAIDRELV